MKKILVLLSCILLFQACSKKEQPYILPPKGDATMESLKMGQNYDFQFFYSLKNKQIVHTSRVDAWDLSFESSLNGQQVFVNGGKGMAVIHTHKTNFSDVSELDCENSKDWIQDKPQGGNESSAFGDWNKDANTRENIYIIRLDAVGKDLRKIKIKSVSNFGYTIEVASINASLGTDFFIEKDAYANNTYFSLSLLKKISNIEPRPQDWDIVFTRYGFTFIDNGEPLPYIVTGTLSNVIGTEVYKDSLLDFYSINESILSSVDFSEKLDIIGFDWKTYNIDQGIYTVIQKYNYIIKTQNDDYFKLRFLDFYDENGMKGSPTFEFAQIK